MVLVSFNKGLEINAPLLSSDLAGSELRIADRSMCARVVKKKERENQTLRRSGNQLDSSMVRACLPDLCVFGVRGGGWGPRCGMFRCVFECWFLVGAVRRTPAPTNTARTKQNRPTIARRAVLLMLFSNILPNHLRDECLMVCSMVLESFFA